MLRIFLILISTSLGLGCSVAPKLDSKLYTLRLSPGDDLKKSIQSFVDEKQIRAGSVVSSVGSLTVASLRFANQKESTTLKGPFEIISLNGTLSVNGSHLHMGISDGKGRSLGGHLSDGSLIYTTAEIMIIENLNVDFKRELDPKTGFKELRIDPRTDN